MNYNIVIKPTLVSVTISALVLGACATSQNVDESVESLAVDALGTEGATVPSADHGVLQPGTDTGTLSRQLQVHYWQFTVPEGGAFVQLITEKPADSTANVDTVLYLYRRSGNTWNTTVTTNDNDASRSGTRFSAIRRSLDAGEYRVVVKGKSTSVTGKFQLRYDNEGSCLFGRSYGWTSDTSSQISGLQKVGSQRRITFSHNIAQTLNDQIQSVMFSNDHVYASLEEMFANVAGNQFFVQELRAADGRSFLAITYYDRTVLWGGIVNKYDATVVARIGGREIRDCIAFRIPTPENARPSQDCARLAIQSVNAFIANTDAPAQTPISIALTAAHSDKELITIRTSANRAYRVSAESYGGAGCTVRGVVGPHSATELNTDDGGLASTPDAECARVAREVIRRHLVVTNSLWTVEGRETLAAAFSDQEVIRVRAGNNGDSPSHGTFQVSTESQGGGSCYAYGFQMVGDSADLDGN